MSEQFFDLFPCVQRLLTAAEENKLDDVSVIELFGPAGCMKLDVARALASRFDGSMLHISWLDVRVRTDKVINKLLCPSMAGGRRTVIMSVHTGFVDNEKLLGLLEYTERNRFVLVSHTKLGIGGAQFPILPLGDAEVEDFLKRASKKCAWKYDKAMVKPIIMHTDGKPRALLDVVNMTQFAKSPGKVVEQLMERKDIKEATALYTVLVGGSKEAVVAEAVAAALQKVGWAALSEHISQLLLSDILDADALPNGALANGAWKLLESFNPQSKNAFVAGCFRIAEGVKSVLH